MPEETFWHSVVLLQGAGQKAVCLLWHLSCDFSSSGASDTSSPVLHISKHTDNSGLFSVSHHGGPARQHPLKNTPKNPFMLRLGVKNISNVDSMRWMNVPQHQSIIKGSWLKRFVVSQTMLEKRGGCHFSVTAAARGVRMVPRAVAASSSISAFSRLITHSMASRP